jgi:hypothetical protein
MHLERGNLRTRIRDDYNWQWGDRRESKNPTFPGSLLVTASPPGYGQSATTRNGISPVQQQTNNQRTSADTILVDEEPRPKTVKYYLLQRKQRYSGLPPKTPKNSVLSRGSLEPKQFETIVEVQQV